MVHIKKKNPKKKRIVACVGKGNIFTHFGVFGMTLGPGIQLRFVNSLCQGDRILFSEIYFSLVTPQVAEYNFIVLLP